MNERIRQLADEAGTTQVVNVVDTGDGRMETQVVTEFDREWFAELIVRECLTVVDGLVDREADGTWTSDELYTDYNGALFEVKRRIEEHFGVEE
jgi:hypothetical protein